MTAIKHTIIRTMKLLLVEHGLEYYRDNATLLCENAAHELGHDEWLDDETHVLWDCAIDLLD